MPVTLEREIKLRFADAETARGAVLAAGATLLHARRLQEDALLDTEDELLRVQRCVLRVRVESGKSLITFKGPVQPSLLKIREELETLVGDGDTMLQILQALGFHIWFRYQKYREEFSLGDVVIAVDETPVGTFVEVEGGDRGVHDVAEILGKTPSDYVLDSYRRIYITHCDTHGVPCADMVFED
jgi:adenylate cyclase, class 2